MTPDQRTELQAAAERLNAWLRDYGDQKQPEFIADLKAVLAALSPQPVGEGATCPRDHNKDGNCDHHPFGCPSYAELDRQNGEWRKIVKSLRTELQLAKATPPAPPAGERGEPQKKRHVVKFEFDDRSLVSIEELKERGVQFTEIETPKGTLYCPVLKAAPPTVPASLAPTSTPQAVETVEQVGGEDSIETLARNCEYAIVAEINKLFNQSEEAVPLWPIIQSALTAATAELQAKVERLEGELGRITKLANRAYPRLKYSGFCSRHRDNGHYECSTCYPDWQALIQEHMKVGDGFLARAEAAESQLTALREQLADKGEEKPLTRVVAWLPSDDLGDPQAKIVFREGRGDEIHVCLDVDDWLRTRGYVKANPSPSRPSGEEAERKLLTMIANDRRNNKPHSLTLEDIAAEVRRIVEGK